MKFVLASHNKGKLKEMAAILGELGIEVASLPEGAPEPEENGATFEENARIKAKAAADFTGLPAIADDSGLCVDALGGAPGIRSARYCEGTDADRNAFLLKNMEGKEDRACRFVCAIACVLADGETAHRARRMRGHTAPREPRRRRLRLRPAVLCAERYELHLRRARRPR